MPCNKCESILVIGKNNEDEMWCPTCENVEILSFEESIKFCHNVVESYRQQYETRLQVIHRNNLLFPLICLRERSIRKVMQEMAISFRNLTAYSLILYDVLMGKCGATVDLGEPINSAPIIKGYTDYIEALKQFQFVRNGYGVILRIPKSRSRTYIDKETKAKENASPMFQEIDSSILAFWFCEEWKRIEKNYSKLDICSGSEAKIRSIPYRRERRLLELRERRMRKKSKNIKKRRERPSISENLGSAFQINLADPTNHMLDFDDIDLTEEVLNAFLHLAYYAENQMPRSVHQAPRRIEDLVVTKSYEEVCEYLEKQGFRAEFVLEQLVSSDYNTKKFPLIIEDGNKLYICPLTLRIMRLYLLDILKRDEIKELRDQQGLRFENEVCKKLEKIGIDFNDPLKKGEKMRNIQDGKKATLEIDMLGLYDSHLFVVECKSNWLNPLWYTQRYQEYRKRDLIEEAEKKMPKRIEWVSNSLQPRKNFNFYRRNPLTSKKNPERRDSLGYPLQNYRIHGIIVTLFEEPLQEHRGITILPIEGLGEIRNLFTITSS